MIVSKFGGTSVGSYEAMCRSAEIIAANPARRLVVISAISGATNNLVQLGQSSLEPTQREELLLRIELAHLEIINKLKQRDEALAAFQSLFSQLRGHLDLLGRDTRWKDTLYAFGELFSTHIFIHVLKEAGIDAHLLDSRHIIKTDSAFGKAVPDIAAIKKAAAKHIATDGICLMQGFIGSDIFGNTTTLGRGGSDFSASLLAEALHAQTLEIWTDVAGIFTCDPRVVPDARPIPEISFDEAAELSVFGGKVLHPATLKPALRGGVGVQVLSSHSPELAGTLIVKETEHKPAIRAISIRQGQTLLTIRSLAMLHQPGFLAKIFSLLAEHRVSVDLVSTSEVSVALTLDTAVNAANKVELSDEILAELRRFAEIEVENDLALLALIGNNLHSTSGISGPLFMELENYNIRLICYGASSHNLCFLVGQEQAAEVARSLHTKFIQPMLEKAQTG